MFRDPEPTDRTPKVGIRLSYRYILNEYVETRSVGEIWRATDISSGGSVAVQFIDPELAPVYTPKGRDARSQFCHEMEILLSIRDISTGVLGYGELPGGHLFVVLKWVEGEWLDSLVASGDALSMNQVLELLIQLGSLLKAGHRNGVLHRAIMPGSIKVERSHFGTRYYLFDFGIGRLSEGAAEGTDFAEYARLLVPPGWDGGFREATDVYALSQAAWISWQGISASTSISSESSEARAYRESMEVLFEIMLASDPDDYSSSSADDLLYEVKELKKKLERGEHPPATEPPLLRALSFGAIATCIVGIVLSTALMVESQWNHLHAASFERVPLVNSSRSNAFPAGSRHKQAKRLSVSPSLHNMLHIPGGTFLMGCQASDRLCGEDERPNHQVNLDSYWIDKTEVTVTAYQECVDQELCEPAETGTGCNGAHPERGTHPINCINWYQARSYCEAVGKQLPTEAQWEYAARRETGDIYPWGQNIPTWSRAVFSRNPYQGTEPVCSKPKGGKGLCDAAGNVQEWVNDCYKPDSYGQRKSQKRFGSESCSSRIKVIRGGSLWSDGEQLRVSDRQWGLARSGFQEFGFRCAVSGGRDSVL